MIIRLNKQKIEADVADSFLKRLVGLSLSKRKNMLFPMSFEDRWSLWMFLVRYPIRMIFIDKKKIVVDIKEGIPITLDPGTWKVYTPEKACKYILETPFGIKVDIGDKLSW